VNAGTLLYGSRPTVPGHRPDTQSSVHHNHQIQKHSEMAGSAIGAVRDEWLELGVISFRLTSGVSYEVKAGCINE